MNDDLITLLAGYSKDPLGFVRWAFPWGEPGELAEQSGPELWQEEILAQLGDGLIDVEGAIRLARTSGHGIGKSALVAWLILWAMSTMPDCVGVVTANTENQLKTKTWVQLAVWYRRCIARDLFKMTATALFSVDPDHEKTWRFDMVPWSERNTEAFAGLHNQGRRILLVFDEASAIPDLIWEVAEGALTDRNTEIIWAVFGNPTRNKGRFRDCFSGGKFAHRWRSAAIDSRSVRFTNKTQIQEWIDDYGEDHDFVRVRVRGIFPRVDAESFIAFELATSAVLREFLRPNDPVVLGVDVGRFGDDASVIYPRCGRDAVTRPIEIYRGIDTMVLVGKIVAAYQRHNAAAVFVDAGGVGGGVVDRLRELRVPVYAVDFGSSPDYYHFSETSGTKYKNKRAEIWGAMRDWLKTGSIPDAVQGQDQTVVDELVGPNFTLDGNEAIQLEGKKDMRRRGVPSPNVADALACTFAMPIFAPRYEQDIPKAEQLEHNPYAREAMAE